MSDPRIALAVGAHPDDVEFGMAGTLALLADAGYEPHIFTIANGSCGTASHTQEEIIRLRRQEGHDAAAVIGATYHPGLVNDIEIYYEDSLLRRVTALVREVRPEIVLVPSPNDYMEDHQNACRLMLTACFCRGMRNWRSDPAREPTMQDVYLYHAQPHSNLDPLRQPVVPSLFVDVTDRIDVKEQMLRCHATQKEWLDVSQGMDSYLAAMREACATLARMAPAPVAYAEGFRQHMHAGFSARDADRLSEVLAGRVQRRVARPFL
jgi:LmbE family N-acetylglucosaminyl deacetylase